MYYSNTLPMLQTMRWFGSNNPLSLLDIRQIGCAGVVTALHELPVGAIWPVNEIQARQQLVVVANATHTMSLRDVFLFLLLLIDTTGVYYGIGRVVTYAASKSAVEGLVKVLASEISTQGMRVTTIVPGFIETERSRMTMSLAPNRRGRAMRCTPMGKFSQLSDISHAAVSLASEAARHFTGVSLPVDGGKSTGF